MMFLSACVYVYLKKRYEILNVGNDHHVYVQYGDIFSGDITEDSFRNIVIPVTRCFDTIIDERDILEYIVKLIKMNKKMINCDVHIVVRNSAKDSLAITNL